MAWQDRDLTESFDVGGGGVGELRFLPPARWRLQRMIGRGGQADVWLAEDLELEQFVVLKVFHRIGDPVAVERMRREVKLGRELHHPGLVRLFDLVEMNGFLVAVMEWIPGGSLAGLLVEEGPLPIGRVLDVAGQVLETLAYLHGEGVVHRDVKPSNLLLASDGRILLGDLGLARRLAEGGDLTRTLTAVGTPAYMAPEQLRGEEPTPAADLYALGVTLFQMLTGKTPFTASSEFEMADAILHRKAPPLRSVRRECPRRLASFVDRLLERSAADRFPDGGVALEAFRRRSTVGSRRRRRRVAAGLVIAGLVLGGGAAARRLLFEPPPLDHVERLDGELVALDAEGRELWRYRTVEPLIFVAADLLGSGEPEVVVGRSVPREGDRRRVSLNVLGRGGRVVGTVTLQDGPELGSFNTTADWSLRDLALGDIDGDGHEDLLWSIAHCIWYPSAAGVWAPRASTHPSKLLVNSGVIKILKAMDLDGDGRDEVVLSGLNNPLGFQVFLAIVQPGSPEAGGWFQSFDSPDLTVDGAGANVERLRGTLTYVPLGSGIFPCSPGRSGPEGIELACAGKVLRLDRDGNPEGSPAYGRGPMLRRRFWTDLGTVCRRLRLAGEGELEGLWEGFRTMHPEILAERPSTTAAALMAARAMADAGYHGRAARLLEETAVRIPEERDLLLRAGEYRLIAGDRWGGRADLLRSLPTGKGGRNPYDQYLLLALDAVTHGDEASFEAAVQANASVAAGGTFRNTAEKLLPALLWAQGRWNDPRLRNVKRDLAVPVLEVLGLWGELERGGDPEGVAAAAGRLEKGSDVRDLACLLHAAAELRLGDAASARGLAESVLADMDREGRRSYELSCWRHLACVVAAEAAAANGGSAHEREWLEEAAAAGPGTWYGRRAVELLAAGPAEAGAGRRTTP